MQRYYAIAEPGDDGSWWISFPDRDGIISAADDAKQIVAQAQDALESTAMHGGRLSPAIEDGALLPNDLSDFRAGHGRCHPVHGVGARGGRRCLTTEVNRAA